MDYDSIRLLTYNVRRDVPADGEYDWDGRRDAVASTLRFHRPDVIGLQEPLAHQYDDVREALPEYEWVGRARSEEKRGDEFCPVGYRPARFDRLDWGTFWLSETPDDPGSQGWDGDWPRIVTWVRLADERTGEEFVYLNTHLDHQGERARRKGAELILDRLSDLRDGGPVVVGGDWNATPEDEPYEIMAGLTDHGSPLTDARIASPHPAHGPTTTMTDYESLVQNMRIDHVFVDGVAVEGFGVAACVVEDGWYPSDHLPVVVDLSL